MVLRSALKVLPLQPMLMPLGREPKQPALIQSLGVFTHRPATPIRWPLGQAASRWHQCHGHRSEYKGNWRECLCLWCCAVAKGNNAFAIGVNANIGDDSFAFGDSAYDKRSVDSLETGLMQPQKVLPMPLPMELMLSSFLS